MSEATRASEPCIDIVVVNWNAGEQIRDCVASVAAHGEGFVDRTVVVDNGSTDGSIDLVAGFPDVTVVRAGENLGFGRACNLGARGARSEFLLFLNPDAQLFAGTLAGAVRFMRRAENARVGICSVQLVDEHGEIGRSCSRFPSPGRLVAHAVGLDRAAPSLGTAMREWPHTSTAAVDQVIGAFFFIRRSLFETLGGFDERFFVYFEEVDLSYRARRHGWGSAYCAEVQAVHTGGGVSRQVKAKRLFYTMRSRILYAFKHFTPVGAAVVVMATSLVEPISRSAFALARGSWASWRETWTAYAMLVRWMWLRTRTSR